MKPNTPTKITVHNSITYSCRLWISSASLLPAGCRFHSSAPARPEKVRPRNSARIAAAFVAPPRAALLAVIVPSPRRPRCAAPWRRTRSPARALPALQTATPARPLSPRIRLRCRSLPRRAAQTLSPAPSERSSNALKFYRLASVKNAAQPYHSAAPRSRRKAMKSLVKLHDAAAVCSALGRGFPGVSVDHFVAHRERAAAAFALLGEALLERAAKARAREAARARRTRVRLAARAQVGEQRRAARVLHGQALHVHHRIGESGRD